MIVNYVYIKKIVFGLVLLHFAFYCLALFANTSFAFPVADDIKFSQQAHQYGVVSFIAHRYQSWNGRYAADTAFGILYQLFDIETNYALTLCIPIIFVLIGYMYMIRSHLWLTKTKLKNEQQGLFFTYWLLLFAFTALHYPGQSLYALNGSATYMLGSSLALIFFVSIIRSTVKDRQQSHKARYVLVAIWYAVYSFFISGFNESLMLMIAVVLICGCYWVVRYRRQHMWLWCGALLANMYGIYTVAVAPGNNVRVNRLADAPTIDTLVQSVPYIDLIIQLILNTGFICVLIVGVYLVIRSLPILGSYIIRLEDFSTSFVQQQPRLWHIIMIAALPILIGAGLLAIIFIRNGLGPHRVRDGLFYFTLPFVPFCMAHYKHVWLQLVNRFSSLQPLNSANLHKVARPVVGLVSVVLCVMLFFGTVDNIADGRTFNKIGNTITGAPINLLVDAYGRGRAFEHSVQNREQAVLLAKQSGTADVTVYPLCTIAPSVYYHAWHENPSRYPNTLFARYYGVNSIRTIDGGCH